MNTVPAKHCDPRKSVPWKHRALDSVPDPSAGTPVRCVYQRDTHVRTQNLTEFANHTRPVWLAWQHHQDEAQYVVRIDWVRMSNARVVPEPPEPTSTTTPTMTPSPQAVPSPSPSPPSSPSPSPMPSPSPSLSPLPSPQPSATPSPLATPSPSPVPVSELVCVSNGCRVLQALVGLSISTLRTTAPVGR